MEGVIGSIVSKIDTVSINERILFFFPRQKTFQYSCVYIFYVLVKLESMENNDLDYTTMINLIQLLGADQAWEHGEEQEQEEGRPQQDVRYLGRRRGWWSTPTSTSSPSLGPSQPSLEVIVGP